MSIIERKTIIKLILLRVMVLEYYNNHKAIIDTLINLCELYGGTKTILEHIVNIKCRVRDVADILDQITESMGLQGNPEQIMNMIYFTAEKYIEITNNKLRKEAWIKLMDILNSDQLFLDQIKKENYDDAIRAEKAFLVFEKFMLKYAA
jgi:flagellar biosynthesis component FlhA